MEMYQALSETAEIGLYILFFLIVIDIPWNQRFFQSAAIAFVIGNLYLGIVCLIQYFQPHGGEALVRISGTFDHPNTLGGYSVLGAALLLWLSLLCEDMKWKIVVWVALGLVLFGALVSISRSAYIALFVGWILLRFYGSAPLRKGCMITLYAGIIAAILLTPQVLSRFSSLGDALLVKDSILRINIWSFLMDREMVSLPFFGLGQGPVIPMRMANWLVTAPAPLGIWKEWGPHNAYLSLILTTGLCGLFAFLWLMKTGFDSIQRRQGDHRAILTAGLIAFLMLLLFEDPLLAGNIPIALLTLLALGTRFPDSLFVRPDVESNTAEE